MAMLWNTLYEGRNVGHLALDEQFFWSPVIGNHHLWVVFKQGIVKRSVFLLLLVFFPMIILCPHLKKSIACWCRDAYVSFCVQNVCTVLWIAGEVYDRSKPSFSTLQKLFLFSYEKSEKAKRNLVSFYCDLLKIVDFLISNTCW